MPSKCVSLKASFHSVNVLNKQFELSPPRCANFFNRIHAPVRANFRVFGAGPSWTDGVRAGKMPQGPLQDQDNWRLRTIGEREDVGEKH